MYMVMSVIWTFLMLLSLVCAALTGRGSALASAALQGAQAGITLSLSMAGAVCLWTGVNRLMESVGITDTLARMLRPLLGRLFPGTLSDPALSRDVSAYVCANFLGLGNAATPMGISAVKRMKRTETPELATDEMCRLIVLNTASIQLIPTNVAAVRSALGCGTPFDLLPAVWVTSLCSAGLGVALAWFLGKVWKK
jgi:spore maturation protein A